MSEVRLVANYISKQWVRQRGRASEWVCVFACVHVQCSCAASRSGLRAHERPDGGAEQLRGARGEAGHRLGGVALAFSRVVHVRAQVSARLRRPSSTSSPLVCSSRALPLRLHSSRTCISMRHLWHFCFSHLDASVLLTSNFACLLQIRLTPHNYAVMLLLVHSKP